MKGRADNDIERQGHFLYIDTCFTNEDTCLDVLLVCPRAEGMVLQINGYSAQLGTRYALASNHLWTWAIHMDGSNNMRVSKPIRFDSKDPTVLMVSTQCLTIQYC